MRLLLVVVALVVIASPAAAQSFDWKPTAIASLALADPASTEWCLAKHPGDVERNPRYFGHDGFTMAHPDTARMWRDQLMALGAIAAVGWVHHRMEREQRPRRVFKWLYQGLAYANAGKGVIMAGRNVKRCRLGLP